MKLLEEIDELLTYLEDTAHGEEGKRITEMRYKIHTELSNSNIHSSPSDEEMMKLFESITEEELDKAVQKYNHQEQSHEKNKQIE